MSESKFKTEGKDMKKFRDDLMKIKADALKHGLDIGKLWKELIKSNERK